MEEGYTLHIEDDLSFAQRRRIAYCGESGPWGPEKSIAALELVQGFDHPGLCKRCKTSIGLKREAWSEPLVVTGARPHLAYTWPETKHSLPVQE